MNLIFLYGGVLLLHLCHCAYNATTTPVSDTNFTKLNESSASPKDNETEEEEDARILHESITKYGLALDYDKNDLPGPEITVDDDRSLFKNYFDVAGPTNYTWSVRTITRYFGYNARYEQALLKEVNGTQIPVIKGQFGEHLVRKHGDFYIRTIGYTLDENGFRHFLVDLTKVETTIIPLYGYKPYISSTVLITLSGGNSLG